jgi:hypothetical protein
MNKKVSHDQLGNAQPLTSPSKPKKLIELTKKRKPDPTPNRVKSAQANVKRDISAFVDPEGNVTCRFCRVKVKEHQHRSHLIETHKMHPAEAERWLRVPPDKERNIWVSLVSGGLPS